MKSRIVVVVSVRSETLMFLVLLEEEDCQARLKL